MNKNSLISLFSILLIVSLLILIILTAVRFNIID